MPPDISSGNIPEGQVHFPPSDTTKYTVQVSGCYDLTLIGPVAQAEVEAGVDGGLFGGQSVSEHVLHPAQFVEQCGDVAAGELIGPLDRCQVVHGLASLGSEFGEAGLDDGGVGSVLDGCDEVSRRFVDRAESLLQHCLALSGPIVSFLRSGQKLGVCEARKPPVDSCDDVVLSDVERLGVIG